MRGLAALALWLAAAAAVPAQPAPAADPHGEPRGGRLLRDPDFGVATRQFGLERQVEMYQWRRREGGYAREWSSVPVDSGVFPPGYANPPFPLRSRRWIAADVTLDGHPLPPDTLVAVGVWRTFRPNFSRLPGNLLATFQPEGDGLGTADNPLAPEIGDLRITWRELVLPPLSGRLELRQGRWMPVPPDRPAAADPGDRNAARGLRWLVPALAVLLIAGLALRRRRRRRG